MRLHIVHKCGQPRDGGVLRRCAGVSAGAAGGKFHVRLTFFKHADHGKVAGDAADRLGDDAAALITDEKQLHAAPLKLRHKLRRAVAGPLLRAGGGEIHVACRSISLGQKLLDRLEKGHERALGVRCAAPPDLAVRDLTGKRRVLPYALGGDHVLMAHQQNRLFAAFALPAIEQIAVDHGALQFFMHERKERLQRLVEGQKFFNLRRIRMGGGVALNHARELFRQKFCPLFVLMRLIFGA